MEIDDDPIEIGWRPKTLIDIPPEMVASIAMGMEDPDEIADRHGFTGAKWEKLKAWKPFNDTVAMQRAEFEKTGVTFRLKSAMKADMLADQVFVAAMGNDVPLGQKLATLQYFTKAGDLEPKDTKNLNNMDGFSISINIGGPGNQTVTVEGAKTEPADVLDVSARPTPHLDLEKGTWSGLTPLVDPKLLEEMQANAAEN